MKIRIIKTLGALSASLFFWLPGEAITLTVHVLDVASDEGNVGTAVFLDAIGFPMEPKPEMKQMQKATAGKVVFVFKDLRPGHIAVAAAHDVNGNGKTDMNLIGIPKEDWGVSNNVRPDFRAPKFQEACFELTEDTTIKIHVDR